MNVNVDAVQHDLPLGRETARAWVEWGFVAGVVLLLLALTSLPYLFGYLTAPVGKQFMGLMLDVPDHGQYFSWMRELTDAHLSANKLTPEPNRAVFFNLLWWGLGRLGGVLNLGYAGVYQILRVSAAVLFLPLAYRVTAWFLPDLRMRRMALLLIAFTSGFGWILVVVKYLFRLPEVPLPLDLYVAEGNTFLSLLGYPHFIAAALYIFVFDLVLRGEVRGQLRYAVAAGFIALFLGWQHAYDLVLVYGILAAYAGLKLIRDRALPTYLIWSGLIIGIISWWPALYSVILTSADPVWEEVLAQFANAGVFTPGPLHLPILLGLPFILAAARLVWINPLRLGRLNDRNLFLLAWFGANLLLIYIPTDFQIHMLNGWQVPMAILAVQAVVYNIEPWLASLLVRRMGRSRLSSLPSVQSLTAIALLLAVLPTNLYLFSWRFVELSRHTYPYYLHDGEVEAMEWLEQNGEPDEVVLSSLTVGQYIPALTGKHAFLAHWAQTLDFFGKQQMVSEFFDQSVSNEARLQVLQQYGVDYVFYGPAEQELGEFAPAGTGFLELVYESSGVSIYAVPAALQQAGNGN